MIVARVRPAPADRDIAHALHPAALAAGVLAILYATIVRAASGSTEHLLAQLRTDWYLLVPIVIGFGVQVGLFVELRRRRALHAGRMAATSLGTGTSVAGMVACCAHHLADLVPFLGLSAAAPFLYRTRVTFMLLGLAANVAGIAAASRHLRRLREPHLAEEGSPSCASH